MHTCHPAAAAAAAVYQASAVLYLVLQSSCLAGHSCCSVQAVQVQVGVCRAKPPLAVVRHLFLIRVNQHVCYRHIIGLAPAKLQQKLWTRCEQ
jgi:hypothetical protein